MELISRTAESYLLQVAGQYPVVTITGPRQSGKTTLCRKIFADKKYVSLENLDTRQFAREDPRGFLAGIPDGAILDEIQHAPDLLSYIQTIVDDDKRNGLFILTGSQQFEVTNAINQSLAGRTALLKLLPFSIEELSASLVTDYGANLQRSNNHGTSGHRVPQVATSGTAMRTFVREPDRSPQDVVPCDRLPSLAGVSIDRLLLSGFYPRIWKDDLQPAQTHAAYLETYVERDLGQLINIKDLGLFQRFVTLCAGRVGQLLNFNNLAADAGVSHQTARNWLTLLEASYIVFRLPPYAANISKRLVKSPKLYFYDVGLAAHLLGLENELHVSRDPLRGNLFENMVIMEALKFRLHRGSRSNLHFYRDSNGNEVDLLLSLGPDLYPVEIKSGMTINRDYFKGLDHFAGIFPLPYGRGLVYGGDETQQRTGTSVCPATRFHVLLAGLVP